VISTGALWIGWITRRKNWGEKRGVARDLADLCAQNALKWARETRVYNQLKWEPSFCFHLVAAIINRGETN
jgi:hypothetical protein